MPRVLLPLVLLALTTGCDGEPSAVAFAEPDPPAPHPPAASAFDPAACGRITGRVSWAGQLPAAPPFIYGVPKPAGGFDIRLIPNPNRPDIDEKSRSVAGAVVFLRGVNPAAAKPWDLPPVRVELKDRNITIRQGDAEPRRVGVVRRGDKVVIESKEPVYHVLRARGASYFSLTFPDPDQPITRTFDKPGRVELSSGAGYYWASADLFVTDHPYYAVTDRAGNFAFEQVPAGPAEVVAWLPGWGVAKQERDPESGMVVRQTYAPPKEAAKRVTVAAGTNAEAGISLP